MDATNALCKRLFARERLAQIVREVWLPRLRGPECVVKLQRALVDEHCHLTIDTDSVSFLAGAWLKVPFAFLCKKELQNIYDILVVHVHVKELFKVDRGPIFKDFIYNAFVNNTFCRQACLDELHGGLE